MRTLTICFLLSAFYLQAQVPRTRELIRPTTYVHGLPRWAPTPGTSLAALVYWTIYRATL